MINIESKRYKLSTIGGILSLVNKLNGAMVCPRTEDLPHSMALATMNENQFDKEMDLLMKACT